MILLRKKDINWHSFPKEFSYDYWTQYFLGLKYELHFVNQHNTTYSYGDLLVRVSLSQTLEVISGGPSKREGRMSFIFQDTSPNYLCEQWIHSDQMEKLNDIHFVCETVTNPEDAPLLMGVEWAAPVMGYLLKVGNK